MHDNEAKRKAIQAKKEEGVKKAEHDQIMALTNKFKAEQEKQREKEKKAEKIRRAKEK